MLTWSRVQPQDIAEGQCESMRACYTGGEALPMPTARSFRRRLPHCRLWNLYGPTETTVDVTGGFGFSHLRIIQPLRNRSALMRYL